ARAVGLWANEAANDDLQPHAPAETGQVVEPAGVPAAHAASAGAADGAGRRGGGDRQVDGELFDIETGADEAAPFGGVQQLERKQREAPGAFLETDSRGDATCLTTTPRHRERGRSGKWPPVRPDTRQIRDVSRLHNIVTIIGRWRRSQNDQGWPAKLAFQYQTDRKQR